MGVRGIDISLLGDKKLDRKFRKLSLRLEKKVLRSAMRNVANKIILPAIKSLTPVGPTGKLRKLMKVRSIKRSRERVGVFIRTPTRPELGLPEGSEKGYYPAVIEYGSDKLGIKAVAFMRRGFKATEGRARKRLAKQIGAGIVKLTQAPG